MVLVVFTSLISEITGMMDKRYAESIFVDSIINIAYKPNKNGYVLTGIQAEHTPGTNVA